MSVQRQDSRLGCVQDTREDLESLRHLRRTGESSGRSFQTTVRLSRRSTYATVRKPRGQPITSSILRADAVSLEMDSMRSLNSSLPSSRSSSSLNPDLLQAFRSAALSVTNLYKSAAADQANSRQAGYQNAMEDLLKFLDDENLGVQDGEGWRIRQWATQRYDGGSYQQQSEGDDDEEHDTKESSSATAEDQHQDDVSTGKSSWNNDQAPTHEDDAPSSGQMVFKFTGVNEHDSNMQTDVPSSSQPSEEASPASPPIRVGVLNRSKSSSRNSNTRHPNRSSHREFTFTAGTKRKLNFPDFFDISNMSDKRDGNGVSKRGRY